MDNSQNGQNGQWEKKSKKEMYMDQYRFNGERYSFRGCEHWGPDDIIPQKNGLYAFPKEDMKQIGGTVDINGDVNG